MSTSSNAALAPSRGFAFGSGNFSLGENVEQYSSIVRRSVASVEAEPARAGQFECRSMGMRLGVLQFTRIQSDAVLLRRSVRCIDTDGQTQYLVGLNLSGSTLIEHSHGRTEIRPGSLFLLDKAAPYNAALSGWTDRLLIAVPRRELESRLVEPARYLSVTTSTEAGIGRLVREHLQFLIREGHTLPRAIQTHTTEMCLDLIALALKSCEANLDCDLEKTAVSGGQMLLSRAKAQLQGRLDDPELTPAKAAELLGLSKRYLHKLFSDHGTAFGAWVREERLLRARLLLMDPRYNHLTITEVAMRQGFNDIPHFSRQFRAQFGISPTGARKRLPSHNA